MCVRVALWRFLCVGLRLGSFLCRLETRLRKVWDVFGKSLACGEDMFGMSFVYFGMISIQVDTCLPQMFCTSWLCNHEGQWDLPKYYDLLHLVEEQSRIGGRSFARAAPR